MIHRAQEHLVALACLSLTSCAPREALPEKDAFVIDECAPYVELYSVEEETQSSEESEDIPEGMVEMYIGTAPRLPEGCA